MEKAWEEEEEDEDTNLVIINQLYLQNNEYMGGWIIRVHLLSYKKS